MTDDDLYTDEEFMEIRQSMAPKYKLSLRDMQNLRKAICDRLASAGLTRTFENAPQQDGYEEDFIKSIQPPLKPHLVKDDLELYSAGLRKLLKLNRQSDVNLALSSALKNTIYSVADATNFFEILDNAAQDAAKKINNHTRGAKVKSTIDVAMLTLAQVYCEEIDTSESENKLSSSPGSPFILFIYAALTPIFDNEIPSHEALSKRWLKLKRKYLNDGPLVKNSRISPL